MADASAPLNASEIIKPKEEKKKVSSSTLVRVARYTAVRLFTLVITTLIALYLTILIANMGGYVDKIQQAQIQETINMNIAANPGYRTLSPEARSALIQQDIALESHRLGLDQPFIIRSFNFLKDAVTLNLGRAFKMTSNSGSSSVRAIILERLPATLVLFGTSDIFLFFLALIFALMLSRVYGSFWDKVSVALTPFSSAPGWFYGIFLILLFAAVLHVLPFGGMLDAPPPSTTWGYFLSLLDHLILPMAAYALSQIFLSIYTWRTFFLIYSSEDYVDMAKAKGLPDRDINNKYILRPTLPTIITSFALTVINSWLGAPIFETIFSWPGLGRALYQAIGLFDTPVILGETVIFSYLLAITVFLLDIVYAVVDPRVKIGGEGSQG
ncbi:MAG: ABC transporter permease [Anaerolineaceae bacterium]|jgi:peptide/nickel transport system permease protein